MIGLQQFLVVVGYIVTDLHIALCLTFVKTDIGERLSVTKE